MVFDLTETCGYAREWSLSGQVHGESKKDSYEEWSGTLIPHSVPAKDHSTEDTAGCLTNLQVSVKWYSI